MKYELVCPKCGEGFTTHLDADERLMYASNACPYCGEPVFMIKRMGIKEKTETPPTLGISVSDGARACCQQEKEEKPEKEEAPPPLGISVADGVKAGEKVG